MIQIHLFLQAAREGEQRGRLGLRKSDGGVKDSSRAWSVQGRRRMDEEREIEVGGAMAAAETKALHSLSLSLSAHYPQTMHM